MNFSNRSRFFFFFFFACCSANNFIAVSRYVQYHRTFIRNTEIYRTLYVSGSEKKLSYISYIELLVWFQNEGNLCGTFLYEEGGKGDNHSVSKIKINISLKKILYVQVMKEFEESWLILEKFSFQKFPKNYLFLLSSLFIVTSFFPPFHFITSKYFEVFLKLREIDIDNASEIT